MLYIYKKQKKIKFLQQLNFVQYFGCILYISLTDSTKYNHLEVVCEIFE